MHMILAFIVLLLRNEEKKKQIKTINSARILIHKTFFTTFPTVFHCVEFQAWFVMSYARYRALHFYSIFKILINYLKHVRTLPFLLTLSNRMANKIIWWLFYMFVCRGGFRSFLLFLALLFRSNGIFAMQTTMGTLYHETWTHKMREIYKSLVFVVVSCWRSRLNSNFFLLNTPFFGEQMDRGFFR